MRKANVKFAQIAALSLILVFWGISLIHIDRSPPLHDDETWILSPGYKLFTQGVFGSDMFTGFHSMERNYLQFMPLMPLLQGANLAFAGIGTFQMRFMPVVLGTLTVALTFSVGRKLLSPSGAILAMLLLMFWPWTSPSNPTFATGIPVFDVTRVARYDILAPVFGLAALLSFIRSRQTLRLRYDFMAGVLAGLAALSQSYGLFWVAGLGFALAVDRVIFVKRGFVANLLALIVGTVIVCLPWALILAINWNDFVNQQLMQPERFDLLNAGFYLSNALNEPRRYLYGSPRLILTSVWLLIGIPAALAGMFARTVQRRSRRESWLLALCVTLPLLFALLLQPKGPFYLPSIAVLFALLIAWLITQLYQSHLRILRLATIMAISVTLGYGTFAVAQMHDAATRTPSPAHLLSQLQEIIPSTARVLGKPPFWLALPSDKYRAIAMALLISNPERNREPISFDAALTNIAPDFVLLDADTEHAMATPSNSLWKMYGEQFAIYMRRHDARLVTVLHDNYGKPLKVFELGQTR